METRLNSERDLQIVAKFRVLDLEWRISGMPVDLIETFSRVHAPLRVSEVENNTRPTTLQFHLNEEGPDGIQLTHPDGSQHRLLTPPWTYPDLHMAVLNDLYNRVEHHWLLHGAALAYEGRGLAILGASGLGKSTLSLALASRGWSLLSDEFAAVAHDDGRLWPFPRLPGSRHQKAEDWWSVPDFSGGEKWFPPPEYLTFAHEPIALTAIVLLSVPDSVNLGLHVAIRSSTAADEFAREANTRGMSLIDQGVRPPFYWLRFGGEEAPILELCREWDKEVIYTERIASPPCAADWRRAPRIEPVTGSAATLALLAAARNRGRNSRLLATRANRLDRLLFEIGKVVGRIPVYQLQVGELGTSLDCIEQLLLNNHKP
ncbi:hypothetical protein CCP3SC1_260013 [Gammaproteobacteria bacterium]